MAEQFDESERQVGPSMNPLGFRTNSIWSIAGSGILQLSNVTLLIAISRMLGSEDLGNYSYAIALCSPIITFSTLGLRNLQVVESSERFGNSDFQRVQLVSSTIAVLAVLILATCSGRRGEAFIAILAVAASQAATSQLDIYFAFFQKMRRMDIVAQCRIASAIITLPSCVIAAYATRNLAVVVIVMLLVRLLSLYFYVSRRFNQLRSGTPSLATDWQKVRKLAFKSVPLAVMTGVATLEVSIPSLVLDHFEGAVSLGHLMVVTTLCLPVPFVLSSILQAALPYLNNNDSRKRRIELVLVSSLGILTLIALAITYLFGPHLLRLFMGQDYVPVERELNLSVGVGFVSVLATILSFSLIAKRAYGASMQYSFVSCLITLVCSLLLIPTWSLTGAIVAPLGGRLVTILLTLVSLNRTKTLPSAIAS